MDTSTLTVLPPWGEIFEPRCDRSDDCWIWTRAKNPNGYGVISLIRMDGGKHWYAHRLSYTLAKGSIPDDMTVDHVCFTHACVRPSHLRLLTNADNVRSTRAWLAGTCQRGGHLKTPYSFVPWGAKGKWLCRICVNLPLHRERGLPDSAFCMNCGHQVLAHVNGCKRCGCPGGGW